MSIGKKSFIHHTALNYGACRTAYTLLYMTFNLQILVVVVARQYGIKLTTWSYNPEKLKNCSAEDLADLRKMIVEESKCTNIPGKLQLFVKKPITGKGSQSEEEEPAEREENLAGL